MTSILSPSLRNTLPSLPLSLSHPYTTVTSLFNISDNYGARHKSKRLGRGTGSGKGKRSGRGMKGYLARQGNRSPVPGFIGGGSSLLRAIPKLGTKPTSPEYSTLNLDHIQDWINQGRLDPSRPITIAELIQSRCIHSAQNGVTLLGRGATHFKTPIDIHVTRASEKAIHAVEKCGGKVTCVYHDEIGLKAMAKPELFPVKPKQAVPTIPKLIAYYVSEEKRGYLAPIVGKDEAMVMRTLKKITEFENGRVVLK